MALHVFWIAISPAMADVETSAAQEPEPETDFGEEEEDWPDADADLFSEEEQDDDAQEDVIIMGKVEQNDNPPSDFEPEVLEVADGMQQTEEGINDPPAPVAPSIDNGILIDDNERMNEPERQDTLRRISDDELGSNDGITEEEENGWDEWEDSDELSQDVTIQKDSDPNRYPAAKEPPVYETDRILGNKEGQQANDEIEKYEQEINESLNEALNRLAKDQSRPWYDEITANPYAVSADNNEVQSTIEAVNDSRRSAIALFILIGIAVFVMLQSSRVKVCFDSYLASASAILNNRYFSGRSVEY